VEKGVEAKEREPTYLKNGRGGHNGFWGEKYGKETQQEDKGPQTPTGVWRKNRSLKTQKNEKKVKKNT